LKDPIGVVRAYQIVRRYMDCQLVLAGGSAADDPEGEVVLEEVRREAKDDPDIHLLNLPPWSATEINALQRASTIIVQKSLREGFGLTVTEALWKKKPVVASAVGGIPAQVIHKHTGLLAHSIEGTADPIPPIESRAGSETGRTRIRARARKFPDYHQRETLPHDFPPLLATLITKAGWLHAHALNGADRNTAHIMNSMEDSNGIWLWVAGAATLRFSRVRFFHAYPSSVRCRTA
jgi:Glycosyl transferases group 1